MGLIRIEPVLLYVAGILWPPVCFALVVARFATRRALKTPLGWDDWLTLPALILILGMAATVLAGVATHALGYHTPQRPAPDRLSPQELQARKTYWSMVVLQTTALTCIKLSCLLFYRRVFHQAHRAVVLTIDALSVLCIVWGVAFVFSWTFGCGIRWDYLWDATASMSCPASYVTLNLALSFSDTVMDLIILVLPIPLVSRHRHLTSSAAAFHQEEVLRRYMSTTKKIALIGIFALGAAAIAASVVRVVIICLSLNLQFAMNADQNLISTVGIYVIYIEACFALCAICLPTLAGSSRVPRVAQYLDRASQGASYLLRSMRSSRGRSRQSLTKNLDGTPRGSNIENDRKDSSVQSAPDKTLIHVFNDETK